MFFKRKKSPSRRRAVTAAKVPAPLSPRFARLVRESWWLLVVAGILWLSLVLASYTKTDPGWSFSGAGLPLGNKGGVVGAWIADLLLYLFGFSAWWWVVAGVVLVIAGFRRVQDPERETDHPFALAVLGFVLLLFASAALEAIRIYRSAGEPAACAGRRCGRSRRPRPRPRDRIQRGDAGAAGAVRRRLHALLRRLVAQGCRADRHRARARHPLASPPRRRAPGSHHRRAGGGLPRGDRRAAARRDAGARADHRRAGGGRGAEDRSVRRRSGSVRCSRSCPTRRCRRWPCSTTRRWRATRSYRRKRSSSPRG